MDKYIDVALAALLWVATAAGVIGLVAVVLALIEFVKQNY